MEVSKLIHSRVFIGVVLGIFVLAILVGAFGVGLAVGLHKARFSYSWGENYERNFAGPRGGMMGGIMGDLNGRGFINAHGVAGEIIKIEDKTLTIKDRDGVEKIVLVADDTAIRRMRTDIKLSDLKTGDQVVIIGEPNSQGQLEARFVRILQ